MRLHPYTGLLLSLLLAIPAASQHTEPWVAIEGIDPVLLVAGEERQGKRALHADYKGFRYLFVSAESRDRFLADPARYSDRSGGVCARMGPGNPMCPHALAMGGPPGVVNPDIWAVVHGRIYLFWTVACRDAFAAAPDRYLQPVPPPLDATDASQRRARALIDEVVAAAGGAERFAAVTSYVATSSRTVPSPAGDLAGTATVRWIVPDRVRIDIEGGPMTSVAAAGPDHGFILLAMKGRGRFDTEMAAAQRVKYTERLRFHDSPLGILLARDLPGFTAAALEPATDGENRLDRIAVRFGEVALTLGIDEPRRIRTMTFVDRDAEGLVGDRVLSFDDHRAVQGISVPHTVTGRFNGKPDAEWTWTVTSVRFNDAIDPALFTSVK